MREIIKDNYNVSVEKAISASDIVMLENENWMPSKTEVLSLVVILMERRKSENEVVIASEIRWFLRSIYTEGVLNDLDIKVWCNDGENKKIDDVLIELSELKSDFKMKGKEKEFYRHLINLGGITFERVCWHLLGGTFDYFALRDLLIKLEKGTKK